MFFLVSGRKWIKRNIKSARSESARAEGLFVVGPERARTEGLSVGGPESSRAEGLYVGGPESLAGISSFQVLK